MYAYGVANRYGRWYARVRNSWGSAWGAGGSCLMPDSYFWTIWPGWPYLGLDAFAIRAVRQDALDADDLPSVREPA